MDLTKLEAGMMPIHASRGNLNEFIQTVIIAFQEQADSRMITLTVNGQLPGEYCFDAEKLKQMLVNLLSNALKFTPKGGRITITLHYASLTLTVTDTGIGIAADQLLLIFNRFYQVNDSATGTAQEARPNHHPQEGTGIGPALVKELAERQGGDIRVESEVGKGTSFILYVPYHPVLSTDSAPTEFSGLALSMSKGEEAIPDLWKEPYLLYCKYGSESTRD